MRQTAISLGVPKSACLGAMACVSRPPIEMAEKEAARRNLVFDVSAAYRDAAADPQAQ